MLLSCSESFWNFLGIRVDSIDHGILAISISFILCQYPWNRFSRPRSLFSLPFRGFLSYYLFDSGPAVGEELLLIHETTSFPFSQRILNMAFFDCDLPLLIYLFQSLASSLFRYSAPTLGVLRLKEKRFCPKAVAGVSSMSKIINESLHAMAWSAEPSLLRRAFILTLGENVYKFGLALCKLSGGRTFISVTKYYRSN